MLKHYKERFKVDTTCALRDLQEIGVEFTQEYLDAIKRNMQSCFQILASIRKAVGVGITMMGVKTMMGGYDNNDDEAKRRGM